MKICDLTQFYSPLSGGVKRYVHEKINYIQSAPLNDEHVLIIPGPKDEVIATKRSRIYSIHSPLISRASRYRALLDLRAAGDILEKERPDIIECADPYQVGWKAISAGRALGIPVIGFYHSHFPEAYLDGFARKFGETASRKLMALARAYVRKLYNQFGATLVPSAQLAETLRDWGVRNARPIQLGVNTAIFSAAPADAAATRESLGIKRDRTLLLYVGRLAPEKNTETLFKAFEILTRRRPNRFSLLVIGDGPQREQIRRLKAQNENVNWIPYAAESEELARYYRAADLFVHPGTQETFGLVALESQACGTPVVGIRGSRMDQIIFHEQHEWAEENRPETLSAAIENICAQDLDAKGAAASEIVAQSYGWPSVFERLFCIYREVCANYKKQRP